MAGQGAPMGHGGGQGTRNFKFLPRAGNAAKRFKSVINEIATETSNMGQNKFAVQFTQLQKTFLL